MTQQLMNQVVGLKFHSGVLACGRRKARCSLDDVLPKNRDRLTLVICPDISNAENIGSMIRLSAGFGADAIVLGERVRRTRIEDQIRPILDTFQS